jgi:alkylresorcinol/alkylpyrone synthase
MTSIVATSTCLPSEYYPQEVLAQTLRKYCLTNLLDFDLDMIDRFFNNVQIKGRHFALPLDSFFDPPGFAATATKAIRTAVDLTETTVLGVLEKAQLAPEDISQMTGVTLTNAVPGVDARLMSRIPFSEDLKRNPLAGVGCMGGAIGLSRVADYLDGHPTEAAILFSVELASGLWQSSLQWDLQAMISQLPEEPSLYGEIKSVIITAALFGDGAAAVLLVGREHPLAKLGQPRIIDTRSCLVPNTTHLIGMELVDTGLRNILRPEVSEYLRPALRSAIASLLADHNLSLEQISHWIVHPGGPKIIEAVEEEFELDPQVLKLSRETLAEVGNLSSATVLYMLDKALTGEKPEPGSYGLLMAMGPGFAQEVILLQW